MNPPRSWLRLLGLGVGIGLSSAVVLLAYKRYRPKALTLREWESAGNDHRPRAFEAVLEHIYAQGISPTARAYIWPYLLGLVKYKQTIEELKQQHETLRTEYAKLMDRCQELDFAHREHCIQNSPGQRNDHKIDSEDDAPCMLLATAQKGILLDAVRTPIPSCPVSSGDPTSSDPPDGVRQSIQHGLRHTPFSSFRAAHRAQILRLVDILCAYAVYDPEIGYCQGMSDLAVPFLVALPEDFMAFWCFARFMRSARENFYKDGSGIRRQLQRVSDILNDADPELMQRLRQLEHAECHFAYRMLLVKLRRELTLAEAMRLWEMLWAHQLLRERSTAGTNEAPQHKRQGHRQAHGMLPFVVAAAIMSQRRRVLRCRSADEVLAAVCLQKVHLQQTLRLARPLVK